MLVPQICARPVPGVRRRQGGNMANTGKSNAHLGIHHPFGARHGKPVPGQRPSLAASHESLAERMYDNTPDIRRHPLPLPPDASLEERIYRQSVADVVVGSDGSNFGLTDSERPGGKSRKSLNVTRWKVPSTARSTLTAPATNWRPNGRQKRPKPISHPSARRSAATLSRATTASTISLRSSKERRVMKPGKNRWSCHNPAA